MILLLLVVVFVAVVVVVSLILVIYVVSRDYDFALCEFSRSLAGSLSQESK